MTKRGEKLSEEDRILWNLVARTAKALPGRQSLAPPTAVVQPDVAATPKSGKAEPPSKARSAMPSYTPPVSQPRRAPPTHLDVPTLDKLAKGRLPLEARVDLHGMTQDEAHALLYSFLLRAHASGARYVLVITGKGSSSGGDGILKRAVPGWLATPLFRQMVSSHDLAARGHGGSGAIYVRLRRKQ